MRGILPETGGNPRRILEKLNGFQAVRELPGPKTQKSPAP